MTRTLAIGERARLQSAHFQITGKAEVQNADGTYINVTSHFRAAQWSEDLDNPVSGGTAQFLADLSTASLAPFVETSLLNRDDLAAYAPLLEPGRRIRLSVAITDPGVSPSVYREVFLGKIDAVDPAASAGRVTCDIRDIGAYLMDAQIETKRIYGAVGGVPVETVMQQILDDNLSSAAPVLYVPVSPAWDITEYEQDRTTVFDAIRTLALQIGWDLRYQWDSSDVYRLTLYEPNRLNTTSDFTMGPSEYLGMSRLRTSDVDVRNVVKVLYTAATGERREVTYKVDASITKYGRRYMEIAEADSSNIDTETEATAMARGAALDLCFPLAEQEIKTMFFPVAELGDLVGYPANANVYTDDQQFATVGIRHELELQDGRTTITARGSVAGAYLAWLRKSRRNGPPSGAPAAPQIDFVVAEADSFGSQGDAYDGGVWVGGRFSEGCIEIAIFAELGDGPLTPVPDRTATTEAMRFQRPQGTEGTDPNYRFLVRLSTRANYYKRIIVIGYGEFGEPSPEYIHPVIQAVDPIPTPVDGAIATLVIVRNDVGAINAVTVTPGSVDTTYTDNNIVIRRNGIALPMFYIGTSLAPVTVLDAGLENLNAYSYEAFIFNGLGVSGPKLGYVAVPPTTTTAPRFTASTPRATLNGTPQVPVVYFEGVTGTVGADRMMMVKSVDRLSTDSFGVSAGLTPYIGIDPDTGPKWYKLVAFSSTDATVWETSPWVWWPGIDTPGSGGLTLPVFVNGSPKVVTYGTQYFLPQPALYVAWEATTSFAVSVTLQRSPDNGVSPWVDVTVSAFVSYGEYYDFSLYNVNTWYRLRTKDVDGTVLTTSVSIHFIPT